MSDQGRTGDPAPNKPRKSNSLVRPYAVTGGRTAPRIKFAMEALVSIPVEPAAARPDISLISPEYQTIIGLARQIRSVAEISALLRQPLGVVRVLIADMAAEGFIRVHQPALESGKPDLNLLERVLSGLRRL